MRRPSRRGLGASALAGLVATLSFGLSPALGREPSAPGSIPSALVLTAAADHALCRIDEGSLDIAVQADRAGLATAQLTSTASALAPVIVGPAVVAAPVPAAELRVTLGRLLGEHTFLLAEAIRAASLANDDAGALKAAIDENSADLKTAIASVYGDAAGGQFDGLWQQHITLLIDYATAQRTGDDAEKAKDLDALAAFREALSSFLAAATPGIDANREAQAIQLHLDQLTAFASADFATAYSVQREAFHHMFELGDQLALGIAKQFPDRFAGANVAFSPASDLRVTLDRLLGEHLIIAAEAMRAGLSKAPDSAAARDALDANTNDLVAAIGAIYGSDAGTAFGSLWRDHTTAYLAFIDAVAKGDANERAATLATLHVYHDRLAAFFASANPKLDAAAIATMIQRHVQALISQVEAYAAGDYPRSIATVREAYLGMFQVGDTLAAAIAAQFPDRFQDLRDLPATSTEVAGGAKAPPLEALAGLLVMTGLVALLVSGVLERRVRRTDRR